MKGGLTPSYFSGQRVLMIGLGQLGGGESTVRWLCRQRARVFVTDLKRRTELAAPIRRLRGLAITWRLGEHRLSDVDGADIVVVNPGVSWSHPLVRRARRLRKPVWNEASIFFAFCPVPITAVTGTRGKTTTALLLGAMMKASGKRTIVAGNTAQQAMLDVLPRIRPDEHVVLELSSFQLEGLAAAKRSPHVAVMTNILPDHLNRYASMSRYAAAKYAIVAYQRPNDFAVLNHDMPLTRIAASRTAAKICWYGIKNNTRPWSVTAQGDWAVERKNGRIRRLFRFADGVLPGRHNQYNRLAAAAAAQVLGVTPAAIRKAVQNFSGVPHRQQLVRVWRGHHFINDTTATTPDGVLAALGVWPNGLFIIGGTDKRLSYGILAKAFSRRHTSLVLLPGTATVKMRRTLKRANYRGRPESVSTMAAAVRAAVRLAKPDQPIILSPGATSFGLFQHEFDRGDQFMQAVKAQR